MGKNNSDFISEQKRKMEEKLKIPYYQVAKKSLTKKEWHGLSEEEAEIKISSSTLEEIDGIVWAKETMDTALKSIVKNLGLTEKQSAMLDAITYTGINEENKAVIDEIKEKINANGISVNSIIMDTLFSVHDGWVAASQKKFLAREKKHQHMPSELIGWKEAKADLLFIKPIFEALGYTVSEQELEQEYNRRVKEYFLNNKIESEEDLVNLISKGSEFYPALKDQDSINEYLKNKENVRNVVIPQIEQNGIGKVSDVRAKILRKIETTVRDEDLMRLSYLELCTLVDKLEQKVEKMEDKGLYDTREYAAAKIRLLKVANAQAIVLNRTLDNKNNPDVQ